MVIIQTNTMNNITQQIETLCKTWDDSTLRCTIDNLQGRLSCYTPEEAESVMYKDRVELLQYQLAVYTNELYSR